MPNLLAAGHATIMSVSIIINVNYGLSNATCKQPIQDTTTQCRSKNNISRGARERRRREALGGCRGMLPQKKKKKFVVIKLSELS